MLHQHSVEWQTSVDWVLDDDESTEVHLRKRGDAGGGLDVITLGGHPNQRRRAEAGLTG